MLAPAPARNALTAATSPGRSEQRSSSRPTSLTGNPPRPAVGYSSSTCYRVHPLAHSGRRSAHIPLTRNRDIRSAELRSPASKQLKLASGLQRSDALIYEFCWLIPHIAKRVKIP